MELWEYLARRKSLNPKETDGKFAEVLGINRMSLSFYKNYRKKPSKKLGMKIEQATEGQVKWAVMLEKYQEQKNLRTKLSS